ncbi:ABC transporter substrate-binding protein [Neptuniibacter halophilus]|uniref:ABC transporter substrate-binding protein n=1 Tax=Neptuniibacter halophilus TaxID=651666 RepID=UPI00257260A2|nr:extracellular solute-binding protein [Neptuniibacter halophilus]
MERLLKRSALILRRSLALGLSLVAVAGAPLSLAGEQAEQAVKEVERLISIGEVDSGAVIRLVAKQGNMVNFLGRNNELKSEWEARTGILLDVNVMPQKPSLEFIRDARQVDLTISRNREYADLYHQGLIIDLEPYRQRFGFAGQEADQDLILAEQQTRFAGHRVAIAADGDMALLYLRKDLLEDAANRKRYAEQFGQALAVPQTWQEYERQVAFFHDPDNGFFGAVEQRDEASGWMFWMPRYASRSEPVQMLFDEQMKPLINSPAGIAATESYLATVKYSPPGILNQSSNYTFTLPIFLNGNGYSTISTLAAAKILSLPHSKVQERFIAVPMPGVELSHGLNHRSTLIYGNNLVIPATAENKALAYLFAKWITDPDISVRSLAEQGGFADPYRYSHFRSQALAATYGTQVLETAVSELPYIVPAGTGLPGDQEYIAALNRQLYRAASGEVTAAEAMRATAHAWEQITERYGREQQISYWQQVQRLFNQDSDR